MWFLPGLPDGRIGWFGRLHHVVADGIAGVAELNTLLDAAPSSGAPAAPAPFDGLRAHPVQPWAPAPRPSTRDLLLDNLLVGSQSPWERFLLAPTALLLAALSLIVAIKGTDTVNTSSAELEDWALERRLDRERAKIDTEIAACQTR
jgi:hypothetical protein